MNLIEPVAMAIHQLWSSKIRTLLTVLGILIGVASVVAVISIGEGLRRTVVGGLDRLGGGRLIMVHNPNTHFRVGHRWVRRPWDDELTNADLERVRRESRFAKSVLPLVTTGGRLAHRNIETSGQFQGTDPLYAEAMGWEVAHGRFLRPSDLRERARVCVLGATGAEELFGPGQDPLDQLVRLNGERYRVAGVMAEKNLFGEDWGRNVILPYTTVQARITGRKSLNLLFVHARSVDETPFVVAEVESILRRYHLHGDAFNVQDIGQELKQVEQIILVLKAVIGGIAGISLLVGGIGVMNIMLVSVSERTREIGIRKAVGARPGHILFQFLVEAVTLSLFGGLVGLLLGLGLGKGAAAAITKLSGAEFISAVSPQSVVMAVGFSAAVGIFFGVYPALRAARLDPVDALRYE